MQTASKKLSGRSQLKGVEGEALAAAFLIKQGYRILEQNYRSASGEIDIIAREGETLVFVEVKTRSSLRFGPPQGAVDVRKQAKITQVALSYLSEKNSALSDCRFDVVAILSPVQGTKLPKGPVLELIRNAFEGLEEFRRC